MRTRPPGPAEGFMYRNVLSAAIETGVPPAGGTLKTSPFAVYTIPASVQVAVPETPEFTTVAGTPPVTGTVFSRSATMKASVVPSGEKTGRVPDSVPSTNRTCVSRIGRTAIICMPPRRTINAIWVPSLEIVMPAALAVYTTLSGSVISNRAGVGGSIDGCDFDVRLTRAMILAAAATAHGAYVLSRETLPDARAISWCE